jgi:folate-binding protein YgfZ
MKMLSDDYRDLRDFAAPLDLSAWCVVHLTGSDTLEFLQGTATQDLSASQPDRAAATLFLTEKGRPVALAWVWFDPAGGAWIFADEGARSTLRPHFERFRIMEDVEFEGPGGMPRLIGVAGPGRNERTALIAAGDPEWRTIHAEPLSFLLVTADTPGIALPTTVDAAAAEAWRLWVGLPRTGVDFDLDRIATELSLPDTISQTKGCYVGQEVVARTSNRGQVRRHRFGFRFPWSGAPLKPRTEIRVGDAIAGYVTSTALEPGSNRGLGMGYATSETLLNPVGFFAVDSNTTTPLEVINWHK